MGQKRSYINKTSTDRATETQSMSICDHCGEETDSPLFTCNYCGRKHCSDCRLPENHHCRKFYFGGEDESDSNRFESESPSTLDKVASSLTDRHTESEPNQAEPESMDLSDKPSPSSTKEPDYPSSPPVETTDDTDNRSSQISRFASYILALPIRIVKSIYSLLLTIVGIVLSPGVILAILVVTAGVAGTVGTGIEPIDNTAEGAISWGSDAGTAVLGWLGDTTSLNKSELRAELHAEVNERRQANGLANLTHSNQLDRVAQSHANDMANNSFYSHVSPTKGGLESRYANFGIRCRGGENIYRQTSPSDANSESDFAEEVVDAWMNSPGHRENILRRGFTSEGFGIAIGEYDGESNVFVVQDFCG